MDRLEQINRERARRQRRSAVVVGKQGRIVIPVEVRKQLRVQEGDDLLMLVEDGRLILMTEACLQAEFEAVRKKRPKGASAVDQLIEDRRRDFLKEEEELRRSRLGHGDVSEKDWA